MNASETRPEPIVQLIALPDRTGKIDPEWLHALTNRPEIEQRTWTELSHEATAGFSSTESIKKLRGLNEAGPVLLLRSGLQLPAFWLERAQTFGNEIPLAFPGNYSDEVNPALDMPEGLSAETLDSWIWACSDHCGTPVRSLPAECLYIPKNCLDSHRKLDEVCLVDSLFVFDPDRPLAAGAWTDPALRAALGPTRLRLQSFYRSLPPDEKHRPIPYYALDTKPVTLHITHDWGGGVARWINDVAANDQHNNHLVLVASGEKSGTVHGQHLKLFECWTQGVLREVALTPAIADTDKAHKHYKALLEKVIRRYRIGRITVSSLIGHSLDILKTGLPTMQVLHDHYPVWPILDCDPLEFIDSDGKVYLDDALSARAGKTLFPDRPPEYWEALRNAWIAQARQTQLALVAPGREVVSRWQALTGLPSDKFQVIPHGFVGWSDAEETVTGKKRPDGRLNLVLIGRLSTVKGIDLLDQALPELRKKAHLTLLGCGAAGMRFLGQSGVDVILDYQHSQLPKLLRQIAPEAALFLSTTPETWNYVLSECRALGIPPLATRLGSFLERIRHGEDGWLFDPQPSALLTLVGQLAGSDAIDQISRDVNPGLDIHRTLSRYDAITPAAMPAPPDASERSMERPEFGYWASQVAAQSLTIEQLRNKADQLTADLATRTDWARRYERLTSERTEWAKSLSRELEKRDDAVIKLRAGLDQTSESLAQARYKIVDLNANLEASERELEASERELEASEGRRKQAEHSLAAANQQLEMVFASRSWRWTRPLRFSGRVASQARQRRIWNVMTWPRLLRRLLHSLRFQGVKGTLQMLQGSPAAPPAPQTALTPVPAPSETDPVEPVSLNPTEAPVASIIIPVFNKLAYTAACLDSLVGHVQRTPFEVIVVDDCSTDETPDFLGRCSGLKAIRNKENSGFIASCNAGAQAASTDLLVFLNNDTTVTEGWLDALVETFQGIPDAGIVGARLAYPDGRLQEAGGIIFSDASGWNYGRNEDPAEPQYNFTAEADYVSGACLALSRQLFEQLGGFDTHYAPAYYEDTDLCFRVRQAGYKVYCQPACTIIHHEGVSSGTDESSGTKRYQAINREKFRSRWATELSSQPEHRIDSDRPDPVRRARFHRAEGRALLIDATTPMPDHDSGSVRFTAMLELMVEKGWLVSFAPQNLKWEGRYSEALQRAGVEVLTAPAVTSLEAWLKSYGHDLDLVLVSRHYVLEPLLKLLRKHCPNAGVIFDTVDLHFLREERQAELGGSAAMQRAAQQTRDTELSLMRDSDVTLVVSPVEQRLLSELVPDADVRVLSNIHSVRGRQQGWSNRRDLIFVGGFQHPPNVDAAEWLIDDIFPRIRAALPDVCLHLIGSRMPEALREKVSDGVRVHGFVEDLEPFLTGCRLSVAPLRYGAGVKGKVNQAMAWGLPVVATACAAEGMFLVDGQDVLLAESSEAFAAAVVRAYTDETLWETLSDGGLANVKRYFSRAAAGEVIEVLLADGKQRMPVQTFS